MSVISESLMNSPIVIISGFVACEYGKEFDWNISREFSIGDIVYYLDGYKKYNTKQEHLQWFVKFQTKDGNIYSATQLYFVTTDEWNDIVGCLKY